jgi:N6-adenosine-specific RNA methylase IME4
MRFSVILIDPAWTYDDKALAGQRGAGCKYSLMTEAEMAALPVQDLAADDCVMFMWATMPKLQEALDLGRAWGFTYKTCAFTWVKTTKDGRAYRIGMGRWTRSNAELVLLFVRGKPQRSRRGREPDHRGAPGQA